MPPHDVIQLVTKRPRPPLLFTNTYKSAGLTGRRGDVIVGFSLYSRSLLQEGAKQNVSIRTPPPQPKSNGGGTYFKGTFLDLRTVCPIYLRVYVHVSVCLSLSVCVKGG